LWNFLPYPPAPKIERGLLKSYHEDDLRKSLFFVTNNDGTFSYKAGYNGDDGLFNGLATDELLLIRAECFARLGKTSQAILDLNALLAKRWKSGSFVPFTARTSEDALKIILEERRK